MTELWESIRKHINSTNLLVAIVGGIIGIIAGYLAIRADIVSLVDQRINSDAYIIRIADKLRPSMVFDQKEAILIDNGATNYIENIQVKGKTTKIKSGEEIMMPDHIIISPKEYLKIPPFLECLDERYNITSERGKKFEIIYKLQPTQFVTGATNRRFRLEIIR